MSTLKSVRGRWAVFAAVGIVFMAMGSYADTVWTGAINNDFNTVGNWNNGMPHGTNIAHIAASGANVTMSAASPTLLHHVYVGGTGTAPILNISQNLNINTTSSRTLYVGNAADNSDGVVNHTAGTMSANRLFISAVGVSGGANRMGTYNFSGGAINSTGDMYIGQYAQDTGVLNLSGSGTVTVGGVTKMNRFGGNATLNVTGGNLTINFNAGLTINENGSPGSSTIRATIDSTGFSTINVGGNMQFNKAGDTVNRTLFDLALGSGYEHTLNTTYTILDATGDFTGLGVFGNVTEGQILTVNGNEFRANYVTDGPGSQFTITAIPEPATIGMLGLGALITMVVRRRYRV